MQRGLAVRRAPGPHLSLWISAAPGWVCGLLGGAVVVAGRVGGESRSVRADGYGGVVGQLRDLDGAVEGGPVKIWKVIGPM